MKYGQTAIETRPAPQVYSIQELPFGQVVETSSWTMSSTATATTTIRKPKPKSGVTIAIMGATGSGKTTFINLASGSQLGVGRGLQSCTDSVQKAQAFELDGRYITLIDTPGFDDTTKSDNDILRMIADFLATEYQDGKKLSGVIYMHRISDFRMGGISTRNFKMFRHLCGDSTLKNVVIVTNMWGEVSKEIGEARDIELKGEEMFFKPALAKGAAMLRHENTKDSAQNVIRRIMDNHPLSLQIQRELVDEKKDISQTVAGEEVNRELVLQTRKHRQAMRELQEEMQEALRVKDEVMREEIEGKALKLYEEMNKLQLEAQGLAAEHSEERQRVERDMQVIIEGSRRAADRAREEHDRKMAEMQKQLGQMASESQQTRDHLVREIEQLRRRPPRHSKCICM